MNDWHSAAVSEIPKLLAMDITEKNAAFLADCLIIRELGGFGAVKKEEDVAEDGAIIAYINEELNDCEKYYNLWRENGDERFKDLSIDELRHSEVLIKMARESGVSEESVVELIRRHDVFLAWFV
ncbi:MAG: hypothetical protein FWH07_04935 [Oscillospiraceae bacterium]|nr:hypothetical protein [Oscillospiraceae bacterium]